MISYLNNLKNSPNGDFCGKFPESITHVFSECEVVRPIWNELFMIREV